MRPYLLAALLLTATAAQATEPKYWVARRLAAEHHLQVEVVSVVAPGAGVGQCVVEGVVLRSFKGKYRQGSGLAFFQPCVRGEAQPHSGEFLWPVDKLKAAKVLEVFLRPGRGGLETADQGEGMAALSAPTDAPTVRDDPRLVRESRESIAAYEIDTALRRSDAEAALKLARDPDPALRARLLAQVAAKKPDVLDEALTALLALPTAERVAAGMAMGETLVLGGNAKGALAVADAVEKDLAAAPDRPALLLNLYGVRLRAGDPKAAFASLAQLPDAQARVERLSESPQALKGFGTHPGSADFAEKLLAGADALAPDRRREAVAAICGTVLALAMNQEAAQAARLAEPCAGRGHSPAATALAVLHEQGAGVAKDRARAARWYAAAAAGFGGAEAERADARKRLAAFTAEERLAAARLLTTAPLAAVGVDKLIELAKR